MAVIFSLIVVPLTAQEDLSPEEILGMSLEEMMNVKVISASRTSQELYKASADIIVIHKSEIQNRGYQTLEELLQDLPGYDFTTHQPAGEYPTHMLAVCRQSNSDKIA